MNCLRLVFTVLLGMCLPFVAAAQEVIYSQYDKFDYRNDEYSVVGATGGFVYTYRNTTDGALLDAYDDSMNKTATVLLDFFRKRSTRFALSPIPKR